MIQQFAWWEDASDAGSRLQKANADRSRIHGTKLQRSGNSCGSAVRCSEMAHKLSVVPRIGGGLRMVKAYTPKPSRKDR